MKETLEEVAERFRFSFTDAYDIDKFAKECFIEGAKWQSERMYSEEDLKNAFFVFPDEWESFEEWFSQFKKQK